MPKYFFECGGCGHLHPLGWIGDCRDNAQRFTSDVLYLPTGGFDPDVFMMDEHAPIPPEGYVPNQGVEVGCGIAECRACYTRKD